MRLFFLFSLAPALATSKPAVVCMDNSIIKDTLGATVAKIEHLNDQIAGDVERIAESPFFRHYKVDLTNRLCPFKDDSGICGNRACALEPVDDSHLPMEWQPAFLGKLRKDSVHETGPDGREGSAFAFRDRVVQYDYCYPEDDHDLSDCVWVDLRDNVERFTGYSGPHAQKVWKAVYQQNCFGYHGENLATDSSPAVGVSGNSLASMLRGKSNEDVHARMELGGEQGRLAFNREDTCVEQRLFYRLLSGMQASISTHLSYDYLNTTTGLWAPNVDQFLDRVGNHAERLDTLYFNYVLVTRAITKLYGYLDLLQFSSSSNEVDTDVRGRLDALRPYFEQAPPLLNETALFLAPEGRLLKDEFRKRVRNVNAIMSCVGCERCRLWGKIQTAGYGTALKILFELPGKASDDPEVVSQVLGGLKRSEIVALWQTYSRLSHSVASVKYFRGVVEKKARVSPPTGFVAEVRRSLHETKLALDFIFNSYLSLPKNLWDYFLYYFLPYWDVFVGRREHTEVIFVRDL